MFRAVPSLARTLMLGASLLALSACNGMDYDLRGGAIDTSSALDGEAPPRPRPDERGVISYPAYQVAIARRGDTIDAVANRLGFSIDELARFNGMAPGTQLNNGEVVALPRRVSEPDGGFAGGPITPSGGAVDVSALAGSAIERATVAPPGTATPAGTIAPPRGSADPVRHQVVRGETAYTIARLYGISVRSLAEWNGLGPDLEVREGSYLLIPQTTGAAALPAETRPGEGSPTPAPPSAATPLPAVNETTIAPPAPASPNLAADRTTRARLAMPVRGSIIRAYERGRNEGIDISASAGSNVVAAAAGTVAKVTTSTSGVSIVIIRHDGAAFGFSEPILTVYAQLDGIAVADGQTVTRGQTIAKVRAGNPAFIHFEMRRGLETLDPSEFLE